MSAAAMPPAPDRAGPIGPTTAGPLSLVATFSSPWISCQTLGRLLSPNSAAAPRDGRHSAPWPQPARPRRPGTRAHDWPGSALSPLGAAGVALDRPRTACIWAVAFLSSLTRRVMLRGRTWPFRRFLLDTRLTMFIAPFNTAGFSSSLLYPTLLLWPTCRDCAR